MNQQEINVSQPPRFILGACHFKRMLLSVVVVPQLGCNKDFFALNETFADGPANTLPSFLFVLVIVGPVKETVSCLDSLEECLLAK